MHPQTFKLSLLVWAMNIFNIEKLAESKAFILIHNTCCFGYEYFQYRKLAESKALILIHNTCIKMS